MTFDVGARIARKIDGRLSSLLRYDLSRTDVVKWVFFARQLLMLLLLSVVGIAGLSADLSTRQARDLLEDSLGSESRAIANAIARAAFVPMALEDVDSLASLVDSYRMVGRMGSLRILDAGGAVRAALPPPPPGSRLIFARVPVVPGADERPNRAPGGAIGPIGFVEVGMRRGWIDAKVRSIGATNVGVALGATLVVWVLGAMIIRNLIERTRELIGEARLVSELKIANAELDAFSASVAHDLRAPIRQIQGFAQLFAENYGPALDDEGRRRLKKIQDGARHMGLLVDDLLALARITREPAAMEAVSLAPLAREAVEGLQHEAEGRAVEWRFGGLFEAKCDPTLTRQVFVNLFSNALKYTRPRERAVIEVGATTAEGGERAVFVRDNGVGFDMRHAGKLFGIFQRLHAASDFEGTGVGLATVERIVRKHGGRIWTYAEPDKGATFYFTLEGPPPKKESHGQWS